MIAWLRKAWDWTTDHVWVVILVAVGVSILAWRYVTGGLRRDVEKARAERDQARVDAGRQVAASLEEQRQRVLAEARDHAEARARVEGRVAEVAEDIRQAEARVEGMTAEEVAAEFRRLRQDASTPLIGKKGR